MPITRQKKFVFLLFINHRLVDCQSLKKCIDQVYTTYLPKNMHPFVYLSLELDPRNIDVNVHPTKHEVHFFNEEQIIELIMTAVETKLLGSNNSRVFYTQAKLPGVKEIISDKDKTKAVYDKDFVRTDANEQKITKFFGAPASANKSFEIINSSVCEEEQVKLSEETMMRNDKFEDMLLDKSVEEKDVSLNNSTVNNSMLSRITRVETRLLSVLELRKQIEDNSHKALRELFSQHVFVGCINRKQSLLQYNTKLYLCNTQRIVQELFYQFVMYNFQNFGVIKLSNPLPIDKLALMGLDLPEVGWSPEDGDKKDLARKVTEILTDKGEMVKEYFSMDIDEYGNLNTLPLLLENHVPEMTKLPTYLIRLASEVDWENEKACFQGFAVETAFYYSQLIEESTTANNDWKWVTEHIFYPAVKQFFLPPKSFAENASVLQIADLPSLYKVFERC